MPFSKGDPNINREGRPKKGEGLPDLLENILSEELGKSGMNKKQALLRKLIKMASEGHSWAMKEVFDRLYGKPNVSQAVDITTNGEKISGIERVIVKPE